MIALGAGCGSAQPKALPAPTVVPPTPVVDATAPKASPRSLRVSAPRPELDIEQLLPNFHEELRWPLSTMSHPELAPQFNIAAVFAQPGLGWMKLCDRGVQNRITAGRNRDELEYLRGWCSAVRGDADAACSKLVPLMTSPVLGLAAAVRIDLATIIANAGNVDSADKLLGKHRIQEVEILDTLAATYFELGMERDAYEINRRVLDSSHSSNAVHCRRLVKDIVLGNDDAGISRTKLDRLAAHSTDATCDDLAAAIECRLGSSCSTHFRRHNVDPRFNHLLAAYRGWPNHAASSTQWVGVARSALFAVPVPGSEDVTLVALDAALRARGRCEHDLSDVLVAAQRMIVGAIARERLERILDRCHVPSSDD